VSLRRVFERLGIGLRELEDWNCCGATSYITINKLTAYSISARNLAYAEKMGLDVCAPCSSCYTILSKVNRHMQWGEEHAKRINDVLAAAGLSYSAKVDVVHPLDILVNKVGIEKVAAKAARRLDGIRIAPYYGCQIVRPKGRFDDREEPTSLDELFAALGGTVVPFGSKLRCCGGMLMTTLEEVALKLNRDILAEAAEQRADVVLTTCPLCQMNLEAYQGRIGQAYQETYDIPILFFTQLLGIALGFTPGEMLVDQMIAGGDRIAARLSEVPA
jgi:heterodisulfide reductase subunit B